MSLVKLHEYHRPELIETSPMVCEIWEDGEITLTKGQHLYGQRNLHCIVPGITGVNVPLVMKRGNHSNMVIEFDKRSEV